MKWLLYAVLLASVSYAVQIDVKLYEGTDREAYYQEIRKQIQTAAEKGQRPKEIIEEEKKQLEELQGAVSQAVWIERYDTGTLSGGTVSLQQYYSALNAVAMLRVKQEQQRRILQGVQSKLAYYKQKIERITEAEKPRLLSYQLQFAYYKLRQGAIEEKSALLYAHEQELARAFLNALAVLQCDAVSRIDAELALGKVEIEKTLGQKAALKNDWEKALIKESGDTGKILKEMELADSHYQNILREKIMLQTEQSLCMLQKKQSRDFFKLLGAIETVTLEISNEERPLYIAQAGVLRDVAKEVLGATKLLLGATMQESKDVLAKLKTAVSSPLFVYNEQAVSLLSLFKAFSLIVIGFFVGLMYKRWIARLAVKWPDMSQMSMRLVSNVGYYLIVVVAFMIAIGSIGIDMTNISLIAGALSIGIGFGLQTVVSNLIAGIILMFERTIRIGDTIEISDVLRGRVTDMRIRSTTIKTFDNIDIVVPNSSFIQNNVINWTLDDPTRRIHIPFGVAYGTEVEKVKKVVLEELASSDLKYIKDDSNKQPEIWMVAMNSSSVDFELLVWVEWASKLRPNSLRSDFLILIYNALYKHGIQIPFPQLDLHVKQMPPDTSR